MWLDFSVRDVIPLAVVVIPIIAIVGGITAGIVRTLARQRIIELAQRERIAAIERGIDPSRLPPLPGYPESDHGWCLDVHRDPRHRAQGLLIGGLVTVAAGFGVAIFLGILGEDQRVWAVGLIPMAVGLALLLSGWLVYPRNGDHDPQGPPRPR